MSVADRCGGCSYVPVSPSELQVDHVLPRSLGGKDEDENLQTLCGRCHAIKTILDRDPNHYDYFKMLEASPGLRLSERLHKI